MFFSTVPNKTLIFDQVLTEIVVVCNNISKKKSNKSQKYIFLSAQTRDKFMLECTGI